MTITGAFRSAVSARDVRGIRIMMKDSLLVDPTFNEFNEMDGLASGVSGLYESHDGRDLDYDKSAWNDAYMDKLMVQVVNNFSRERIILLQEIVRHLHPVAARPQQTGTTRSHKTSPIDEQSGRNKSQPGFKKTKMGAVAGGIIGGAIAKVASVSVFVGAVAGAVVVGAVVAVAKKMGLRNE